MKITQMKFNILKKIIIILMFLPGTVFAAGYDRSLLSYFFDSMIWRLMVSESKITLTVLGVLVTLAIFFEKLRPLIISSFIAFLAFWMLTIIYEISDNLSWFPQ